MIDIHNQNDNFLINDNDFKINLLDSIAKNATIKNQYIQKYYKYLDFKKRYANLNSQNKDYIKNLDYYNFLLDEFKDFDLENTNIDKLKQELNLLENSEFIEKSLSESINILENQEVSIISNLYKITKIFSDISNFDNFYKATSKRLESIYIDLKDVCYEIDSAKNKLSIDQEQTNIIRSKLDGIYHLMNKHGAKEIESLKKIKEDIRNKISENENFENQSLLLQKEIKEYEEEIKDLATKLKKSRLAAAKEITSQLYPLFKELSIDNPTLEFNFIDIEPSENGTDKIEILFSANKGIKPKPIELCASGGEISRIMLILKFVLSKYQNWPTIILDEIDVGVSGEVIYKIAKLIKKISDKHQVFVITHQPQVAVKANKHFLIYKNVKADITKTEIKDLNIDERKEEIAKMIGGVNYTKISIDAAEEMLKLN